MVISSIENKCRIGVRCITCTGDILKAMSLICFCSYLRFSQFDYTVFSFYAKLGQTKQPISIQDLEPTLYLLLNVTTVQHPLGPKNNVTDTLSLCKWSTRPRRKVRAKLNCLCKSNNESESHEKESQSVKRLILSQDYACLQLYKCAGSACCICSILFKSIIQSILKYSIEMSSF